MNKLVETILANAPFLSPSDALLVAKYYAKHNIAKRGSSATSGAPGLTVTHGAFLDHSVLADALKAAKLG